MSAFKMLHASIFESAKKNLKRSGVLTPIGILAREKDKSINTIPFLWKNDEEKAKNMTAFGATAFFADADYAFTVLDANLGTYEAFQRGVRPADVPMDDRKDVILVFGFDIRQNLGHAARCVEYKRGGPEMKDISFKPEPNFGTFEFRGSMVDWFVEGYRMADKVDQRNKATALVCIHGRRHGTFCPDCRQQDEADAAPA